MISQWKEFLLGRAEAWAIPRGGDWKFFFHNNYHQHHSNINLLWFHNGSRFPLVVTKIFRAPQIPKREFENLQKAYQLAPSVVPRPLHCGLDGVFWTLWMEGVPGLRFWDVSPAMLGSVVEMVASMHLALRNGDARPYPQRYQNMVSAPLETLLQAGPAVSVRNGCALLAEKASGEWLDSLPIIPQHGDLFIDNILSYKQNWHVVDWESFGTIDLPFYDLGTLLVSRLRGVTATADSWDPPTMRNVPALVKEYARRLKLSAADIRLLLALTLANWFHLQWADGRREFTSSMYKTIQNYFEHTDVWEKVFLWNQLTSGE